MWSEWSPCPITCVEYNQVNPGCQVQVAARYLSQKLGHHGGFKADGTYRERQAKNIRINYPCEPKTMPIQERYRAILKRERFGGSCDIMMMAKNKTGEKDLLVYC